MSSGAEEHIAEMREMFLRATSSLAGRNVEVRFRYLFLISQPVQIQMHGKADVTAVVCGVKGDCSHLLVKDLKTPIGTLEGAVIRCGYPYVGVKGCSQD